MPIPTGREDSLVLDAVRNYLDIETSGALLITGDWGSGKTYYMKNIVFPSLKADPNYSNYVPFIVSVFGLSEKNAIGRKMLFAYMGVENNTSKFIKFLAKSGKEIHKTVPLVSRFVDLDYLFFGELDNIFDSIPADKKVLICFDDLERMSDKINADEFLGVVNSLTEGKKHKVVLIANESEIKQSLNYKEKVIDKTVQYTPAHNVIIDNIINSYGQSKLKSFYDKNRDFFLKSMSLEGLDDISEKEEMKRKFSNIRTVKFAIGHFNHILPLIVENDDVENETFKEKLKNIWLFVLCISMEFRVANGIDFYKRKGLDVPIISISELDLDSLMNPTSDKQVPTESNVDGGYAEQVRKIYFERLAGKYIYYPSVYDLITSGKRILVSELSAQLIEKFDKVVDNNNPALELLESIMGGYYNRSNDQYVQDINNLLYYVKSGSYNDLIQYMNAAVFLLDSKDITQISEEEIHESIKMGITTYLASASEGVIEEFRFNFVSSNYEGNNIEPLVEFAKKSLEIYYLQKQRSIDKLNEDDFTKNTSSFVEKYFKNIADNSSNFYKVNFGSFDEEAVEKSVANWQPIDVVKVVTLLQTRYVQLRGSRDFYADEKGFVNSIAKGIDQIDLSKKTLLTHVIKKHMIPVLDEIRGKHSQS